MVAAKLANLKDGQRADRASPIGEPRTQSQAAELLNVGKRSVERAREVLDGGAPELVQAVEQGRVPLSAAATIASLPGESQVEIVARVARQILEAAKQIWIERAEVRTLCRTLPLLSDGAALGAEARNEAAAIEADGARIVEIAIAAPRVADIA